MLPKQPQHNILTTFILTTFLQHSCSILTTFLQHSYNMLATFLQHSCQYILKGNLDALDALDALGIPALASSKLPRLARPPPARRGPGKLAPGSYGDFRNKRGRLTLNPKP